MGSSPPSELVDELARLNEEFGEQSSIIDHDEVSFDEVDVAGTEGREAFITTGGVYRLATRRQTNT